MGFFALSCGSCFLRSGDFETGPKPFKKKCSWLFSWSKKNLTQSSTVNLVGKVFPHFFDFFIKPLQFNLFSGKFSTKITFFGGNGFIMVGGKHMQKNKF